MATASRTRGWSPGKTTLVAVLAILAVLAIIAGIMYFMEPAKSLPSVLGTITSPASRANAHRPARGWAAIVVGLILLAAAGITSRTGRSASR